MKNTLLFLGFLLLFSSNCSASDHPGKHSGLEGKWAIEFNSNDIGTVSTVFEFETQGNSFTAHTREGAAKDLLGFWKATLAKIFTDDFKNGSLLRVTDGKIREKEDTLKLAGIFRSSMGDYYFNGSVVNGKLDAVLKNSEKKIRGNLKGHKDSTINLPLVNYPRVVAEALDTAKSKIFNPNILTTNDWKSFEKTIREKAEVVQDDVGLVFAFYYYADKLPFSHFALTKTQMQEKEQDSLQSKKFLTLKEKDEQTALLKISSFGGSASEVDSIFSVILSKGYENLIVDLRDNPGGSVEAGMAFARSVLDTSFTGGIFLTHKWFENHDHPPDQNEYDQFPQFTEANYDLIIEGIHEEKGLLLKVIPKEQPYTGSLFIITNGNTASTCEPITYGLKRIERATIVGTRTAGAMLNGEKFKLESGFTLFVPTADYYTSDGYRLDQKGVKPDFKVDKEPVDYVLKELIR